MTVIIDPAIRILPDEHNIYVLHPGSSKRFYAEFQATDSVFLDIPGIQFSSEPATDTQELRARLRMARKISGWRSLGSNPETEPSRNIEDYVVRNPSDNAPKLVHAVTTLYSTAKAGDLLVVPGAGYKSTVLIGEFVGDFDSSHFIQLPRYQDDSLPVREVRWLQVTRTKGQYSPRLIKLMQNRQAIIHIADERARREVYSAAYGDYVWLETSGSFIRVSKDEIDLHELGKAVSLTNYFAAQYIALKKGELQQFLTMSFDVGLDIYYDKNYFGGVSVEVHSPGFFSRKMKDAMLASYVAAMLSLSAADVAADEAKDAQVMNSANTEVSICDLKLQQDIRETMEMYANLHLWEKEICERRKRSLESVGLKSGVEIRKN